MRKHLGNAAGGLLDYFVGADQIVDVMRQHAAAFSVPLDDEPWIVRASQTIAQRF